MQRKWITLPHSFLHILAGPCSPPRALPFPWIPRESTIWLLTSVIPGGSLQKHRRYQQGRHRGDRLLHAKPAAGRWEEETGALAKAHAGSGMGSCSGSSLCSFKGCMRTYTWAPSWDGSRTCFPAHCQQRSLFLKDSKIWRFLSICLFFIYIYLFIILSIYF